jgi:hypothetical protein
MRRRTKILIGCAAVAAAVVGGMAIAGSRLSRRFEPYLREQAKVYLSRRFQSEVEIGALSLQTPRVAPLRLFMTKGRGMMGQVTVENIVMRHKGRRDVEPMFSIAKMSFAVDLGRMFDPDKRVALIRLERMKIVVPPKGERPSLSAGSSVEGGSGKTGEAGDWLTPAMPAMPDAKDVMIERVSIEDSMLVILPRDKSRKPLEFELHKVALNSVQLRKALDYEAEIKNPKPPGIVEAKGEFGPWDADSPSETPLSGGYKFVNAEFHRKVQRDVERNRRVRHGERAGLPSAKRRRSATVDRRL